MQPLCKVLSITTSRRPCSTLLRHVFMIYGVLLARWTSWKIYASSHLQVCMRSLFKLLMALHHLKHWWGWERKEMPKTSYCCNPFKWLTGLLELRRSYKIGWHWTTRRSVSLACILVCWWTKQELFNQDPWALAEVTLWMARWPKVSQKYI